jgi:NAD(P)H-flavin reductase
VSAELFALRAGWARTVRYADRAAHWFWSVVDERCPGLVPEGEAGLFFAGLGRLASGGDDRAGRAAALAVLGRAHRSFGLLPVHYVPVGEALIATVARFCGRSWRPEQGPAWERAMDAAARSVLRAAVVMGDGPAYWPYEVVAHARAAATIAVLTARPLARRSPVRPGQAVPVRVPGRPDRWRWYSPANAPRPDGTVEFHVRAVPGGGVSGALLRAVRPGEVLLLGPPAGCGLLWDSPTRPGASVAARAGSPAAGRDLLLLAGGTGLAPLRALIEQIAAEVADAGGPGAAGLRVVLVLGARGLDDVYDPVALDKLQCAHDWLSVVVALSAHPAVAEAEHDDAVTVGLRCYEPGQEVYVCGPPAMMSAARSRLPAAGIPPERIHLADDFATYPSSTPLAGLMSALPPSAGSSASRQASAGAAQLSDP